MGSTRVACTNSSAFAAVNGGFGLNNGHHQSHQNQGKISTVDSKTKPTTGDFQMPLHYPKYKKSEYEKMPEWQLDCLLKQYGLPVIGDVHQKRKFAMGAFLWPDEL